MYKVTIGMRTPEQLQGARRLKSSISKMATHSTSSLRVVLVRYISHFGFVTALSLCSRAARISIAMKSCVGLQFIAARQLYVPHLSHCFGTGGEC